MFGTAEFVARAIWPARYSYECNINSQIDGDRFKPNCTVLSKIPEGPWTTYHYNECGYRSDTSCGPKLPGTIRIAILGSSVSQANYVPYEDTFFSRASEELRSKCDRPVDVQNLGVPGSSPAYAYRRFDEALKLKPDVILYLVVPYDLYHQTLPAGMDQADSVADIPLESSVKSNGSLLSRLQHILIQSRTILMAQHLIFQDRTTFIRTYMMYGDKADYLRQPFTPIWQRRFAELDLIVGKMADKLKAAGVSFLVIAIPSRAEAALLSSPNLPPHVDPFAFGREIQAIASKHGADYLDLVKPFSLVPHAESLYYVVDGHNTSEGQKLIGVNLAQKLQDGIVPAFSNCVPKQAADRRP